ncbi:dihydroorotase [Methanospirillum hungatei]|jgi:dihydroorotase|uniref:dihydroorotase n=1 Tax=Methanospirillum hungatei TaxID=2203 RepID=UPI0009C519CE|nr:dihydroorotase [Methanospirillum hungatei]MBP9007526.1 dihydroorotase [Methanospirillum sp.]OQA57805.1 MAG: dihydroorotase [Euryarchaeota archaeon ADurb.Bin294]HOW05561.1 dihydroorotase [Methanospirillum hungatei]
MLEKGQEILVLRDVLIPGGRVADITISNGQVMHAGAAGKGDLEISCRGKFVLPAGTDLHVHMRDGPQKEKETWESGTKSAIAGGVTVVVDQPNTIPPLTTSDLIRDRVMLAESQAYTRFAINGGVTSDADLIGMWRAGIFAFGETFAGPSSYGEAVSSSVLRYTMEQVAGWDGLMTIHAEQVTEGPDRTLADHDHLRPVSGEVRAIQDVLTMNTHGCNLHFCHLSSADAIRAIPGGGASREVTPHHLFLSYELFDPEDAQGKVNPPLRSEKVRQELFSCWDQIDIIGSDHAPHTRAEKGKEFELAPSGIPGVETMIPLLMGRVLEKKVSLADVIAKTSIRPSDILGITKAGFSPGDRADFAIYPDTLTRISADNLHSAAGWSPYEGMTAVFPEKTILGGTVVFDSGEFFKPDLSEDYSGIRLWIQGRGYSL